MLVLPGITSPAAVWEFAVEEFARRRRVLILDQRGRGLSDGPPSGYRLEDYAADARAVIAACGLTRPVVLGHSMGARVAAALAAATPEDVGPVVLVDPPVTGPGRPPYPFPLDFYLDGIRAAVAGETPSSSPHSGWDAARLADRTAWLGTCDPEAVSASYRNFHAEDFLGRWAALARPALVVGARSPVVPPAALDELRRTNPTAWVRTVEDAGHMVPWDNLAGFERAVEDGIAWALEADVRTA